MKLSELIKKATELLGTYGDLDLIYCADDERNSFHRVNFAPTVGCYTDEEEFNSTEDVDLVNVICIN